MLSQPISTGIELLNSKATQGHVPSRDVAVLLQDFIQAFLSAAVFCQRFSFFTACLANDLHKILRWWAPKGKFLKFRFPYYWKIPILVLTAEV